MKYTRYDMKRKNNNNIILVAVLFSTLIFALLIGTVVSNLLIKNSSDRKEAVNPNNSVDVVSKETKKTVKYIAVQEGMYKESPNVDKAKNNLSAYGNPFAVQEQNGTRVLLGIYIEEEGLNVMKFLTEKGVANSKLLFEINSSNSLCDESIIAALNAELDVLSMLSNKDVKSIETEKLKKWLADLKEVDKNSKNISLLDEIKVHINSLPSEIEKNKVPEYYTFLYNYLKKLSGK